MEYVMKKIFGFYTRTPLVLRILVGLVIGVLFGLFVKVPACMWFVCLKKVVAIEPLPGREGLFLMQRAPCCYFCGRSSGRSLFCFR